MWNIRHPPKNPLKVSMQQGARVHFHQSRYRHPAPSCSGKFLKKKDYSDWKKENRHVVVPYFRNHQSLKMNIRRLIRSLSSMFHKRIWKFQKNSLASDTHSLKALCLKRTYLTFWVYSWTRINLFSMFQLRR